MAYIMTVVWRRYKKRRRRRIGRVWVEDHLTTAKRLKHSVYHTLLKDFRNTNPKKFFNYTRMTPESFDELLAQVKPQIRRQRTKLRIPISAGERLALTLRYLATGESLISLSYSFRVGHSTAMYIVRDTCRALIASLEPIYLKKKSANDWREIAQDFWRRWDFPNCIGAIDGKHVRLICPAKSGSEYFNYKQFYSIILLAVCDAEYKFTVVDVGAKGKEGDAGVFATSALKEDMESGNLDIPPPARLPDSRSEPVPYCLVGDEAFPLSANLMRPFPGRSTFSLPLSRARRVIENSFGILAARWRIFRTEMNLNPQSARIVTNAAVLLHNFCLSKHPKAYNPAGFADSERDDGTIAPGRWREDTETNSGEPETVTLRRVPGRARERDGGLYYRDLLSRYFINEGTVPWQHDLVTKTGRMESSDSSLSADTEASDSSHLSQSE